MQLDQSAPACGVPASEGGVGALPPIGRDRLHPPYAVLVSTGAAPAVADLAISGGPIVYGQHPAPGCLTWADTGGRDAAQADFGTVLGMIKLDAGRCPGGAPRWLTAPSGYR